MVKINKKYPICDTDIWIKNAKHKKYFQKDLLFFKYEKIYMSDAVRQEIGRERFDDKKQDFLLAHDTFNECYNDSCINMIKLNDEKFFDEELRMAIEKDLRSKNIVYDFKMGKYISQTSDLGETVTVIIASNLGIPIVLCDEEKKDSIIKRYKCLDIRNMLDLLRIHHGNDINTLQKIRRYLSTPINNNNTELFNAKPKSKLKLFKEKHAS